MGVGVAAIVAREPPGQAEIPPVPGSVHRALEPRRVHEGFRKQNRVPILLLPVGAQTAQHRRHRKRTEARENPLAAKHNEPGIVRYQVQTPPPDSALPPDPEIPVPALQRAGLPAGQRDPLARPLDDVAQAAARKPLEAKVMMRLNQRVPAYPLVRPRKAHHHIAQGKPFRRLPKQRRAIDSLFYMPISTPTGAKKPATNATADDYWDESSQTLSVGSPWLAGTPAGTLRDTEARWDAWASTWCSPAVGGPSAANAGSGPAELHDRDLMPESLFGTPTLSDGFSRAAARS